MDENCRHKNGVVTLVGRVLFRRTARFIVHRAVTIGLAG